MADATANNNLSSQSSTGATTVLTPQQVVPPVSPIPVVQNQVIPAAPSVIAQPVTPPAQQPKKPVKPKLSLNMIPYVVIGILLLLIVILSGFVISLVTNGGVDVSFTAAPPATPPTTTPPTTTPPAETPPTTLPADAIEDLIVYLTFEIPAGGDVSPIRDKYVGTVDIDTDTLLVPVTVGQASSTESALNDALSALINPSSPTIDNELIIQFANPVANSGVDFSFTVNTVTGINEDVTEVNITTADDLSALSADTVSIIKLQLDSTIKLYAEAYNITLNGTAEAFANWGTDL